jgi:hypothetical protein
MLIQIPLCGQDGAKSVVDVGHLGDNDVCIYISESHSC